MQLRQEIKARLEQQFPLSACSCPGSNANTLDAKLLQALWHTQNSRTSCVFEHAFVTVGLALLPFSLIPDSETKLGGIGEELVIVVDYDEMQLATLRAIVEVVQSIPVIPAMEIKGDKGEVVDWRLPPIEELEKRFRITSLRSGRVPFLEGVRLEIKESRLYVVSSDFHSGGASDAIDYISSRGRSGDGGGSGNSYPSESCSVESGLDPLRGLWVNRLYDELDRTGVVHIETLSQFLDYFHYSYGRSVASMYDGCFRFTANCMPRLGLLQQVLASKTIAYLHLNLIKSAGRLVQSLAANRVCVPRMNLSNLMDYVDVSEYSDVSVLQNLEHVRGENPALGACTHRTCEPVFIEAYIGGIKTSLAFRACDWLLYVRVVRLYDRFMLKKLVASEERTMQSLIALLRSKCREHVSPEYEF